MNLKVFLESLSDSGRVVLGEYSRRASVVDKMAAESVIGDLDRRAREEMISGAPPLNTDAAVWASVQLYHLCQFFIIRDLPTEAMDAVFKVGAAAHPDRQDAAAIYSVDLVLRYLPDLQKLVRGLAEADPLLSVIDALCLRWPLSSVGMKVAEPDSGAVNAILDHPSLAQLYVDRILETSDVSRWNEPRVGIRVRAVLGEHSELHPEAFASLTLTQ